MLFAAPGGMQIRRRSISPRETASSFSISSLWCRAGSRPQCLAHSVRLARIARRCRRIAAAAAVRDLSGL